MKVNGTRELQRALEGKAQVIEAEGKVADRIKRIKETHKVAFVVAIAAVAGALFMIKRNPTISTGLAAAGLTQALVLWGFMPTLMAIQIGRSSGVMTLKNLFFNYHLTELDNGYIILNRK